MFSRINTHFNTYINKSINPDTKLFQRWHKQHKMVPYLFIWEQVLNTQDSPIKQERKKFLLWRTRSNLFCDVVPVHVSCNQEYPTNIFRKIDYTMS